MPRPTTMNLSEAVAISASSLWAHKLRSVLTLIGVVIGVAAVIAVVSLINGANQYVATRVFRLGADVFGLSKQPSIITNVDDWLEFQKRKRLTYDDYEAVRDLCKSCKEIGASLGGRVEVKSGLDRLGINDALLQFETDLNRSLLPEPQRVLPMLDQIAGDSRFVDIARQRARSLAERIRHQG
jgi:hypothetical protein